MSSLEYCLISQFSLEKYICIYLESHHSEIKWELKANKTTRFFLAQVYLFNKRKMQEQYNMIKAQTADMVICKLAVNY